MDVEHVTNKGKDLKPGMRISKNSLVIKKTLSSNLIKTAAGFHSINEFKGKMHFYATGEFDDIHTSDEAHGKGPMYASFYLRQAQSFVNSLWTVKDHGVYVRDGFLIIYEDDLERGLVFKATLNEKFIHSSGERSVTEYTSRELDKAIKIFPLYSKQKMDPDTFGGKTPKGDHFFNNSYSRMNSAYFFTLAARANFHVPMKIALYCSALECLFNTSKVEVTHKIAERVAVMIGGTKEERKEIFQFIKKAYGFRSSVLHGTFLNSKKAEDLPKVSSRLDSILRELINHQHEIFFKNQFFDDLIFS
jgi:hypothetical protein